MKKKILAAAAALMMLASQSVYAAADWGYDYNDYNYNYDYGYEDYNQYGDQTWTDNTWTDNTWTDNTATGEDSASDSSSSTDSHADSSNNVPVNVILEQSKIVDKAFTVDLKLSTQSKITGIDLTVLYDTAVLKMTGAVVNKKAAKKPGKGVAAETEPGVIQYQFNDPSGSEWKESFLTLSFEVVDPLQKASAIYMKVNSILDEYSTMLSYRADGTIVQIAGEVAYDAKDDESMYTELRVSKSDKPISLEALGFQNVASVTFEDKKLASTDNKSITTIGYGLTNMTVEFTDGTKKYFRLVVSEGAPAAVTTAAGVVGSPDQGVPAADGTDSSVGEAVQPQAAEQEQDKGLVKTETHNKSKVKYLIIYLLVLVALIAIIVEFFVFYGNPYAKTAALLKQRKQGGEDDDPYAGEGFNGSPLNIPDRSGDGYPSYDDGYSEDGEEYGYEDGDGEEYPEGEGFDYGDEEAADESYEGAEFVYEEDDVEADVEEDDEVGDGYEYSSDEDDDDEDYYEDDDDAYDDYEDGEDGFVTDPTRTEDYDGSGDDDDMEIVSDEDILDDDDDEDTDEDGELTENNGVIDLSKNDDDE